MYAAAIDPDLEVDILFRSLQSGSGVQSYHAAAQVAEEASFSVSRTGDRAAALRESLAGELEEARLVVQAAAAARKRAQRDVECLEEDIASLQEEEQTRKVCAHD